MPALQPARSREPGPASGSFTNPYGFCRHTWLAGRCNVRTSMSILQGTRWVVVGLMVAAVLTACSSKDEESSSGYCQTFEARQRECGALGATGNTACVNYEDAPEPCEAKCVTEASCDDIIEATCGSGPAVALNTCLARCTNLPPVTCKDGTQLDGYTRCNGFSDCGSEITADPDTTDEDGCTATGFHCRTVDAWVPFDVRCNGVPDCSDASDETDDCEVVGKCGDLDILASMKCNGIPDCPDGEDEPSTCAARMCE
jgi:Low-density lipoprotein receptor domain class A